MIDLSKLLDSIALAHREVLEDWLLDDNIVYEHSEDYIGLTAHLDLTQRDFRRELALKYEARPFQYNR